MTAANTAGLPAPAPGVILGSGGPAAAPGGLTTLTPGSNPLAVSSDNAKPTYRAGGVGLTLYSAAANVLLEIQGSATKTIRVKRISLWGQAGTKFYTELQLLRSTTIAATGTPVPAALGQHDVNDAAASAVVNSYAGAATYGTGHQLIGGAPFPLAAPSATAQIVATGWDFSRSQDKALILRGTADVIQVYQAILTLGTATFGFEIEWEEDNS